MNVDLLEAIGGLVRALAWPIVALVGIGLFRPELRGLIGRFRRAAGLEFDAPTSQGNAATSTALATLPNDLLPLLPSAASLIPQLRASPLFQGTTDAQRVERLLNTVAFLAFAADAERVEGQIWASQVALLEYLNALDSGDALENLKARFYDPAAARFQPMFANYALEPYIGFLRMNDLVDIEGDRVRITQKGRDYLAWRIQAKKPPRVVG